MVPPAEPPTGDGPEILALRRMSGREPGRLIASLNAVMCSCMLHGIVIVEDVDQWKFNKHEKVSSRIVCKSRLLHHSKNKYTSYRSKILPFNASSYRPSCIHLNPSTSASLKLVGFAVAADGCTLLLLPADSAADCNCVRCDDSIDSDPRFFLAGVCDDGMNALTDAAHIIDRRTSRCCFCIISIYKSVLMINSPGCDGCWGFDKCKM